MGKKVESSVASESKTSSKKSDSETSEKKKKKKVKRPGTKFGAKKGKAFERQIATALGHIFPDAQRMLEYQGSNVIGVDLEKTDIFRFQCKCYANYKNPSAIFEIREKGPHVPVLVTKANSRPPMAVLPFEEFVTLLEMAYGHRERLINPYLKEPEESKLALMGTASPAMLEFKAPVELVEAYSEVVEVETFPIVRIELPPLNIQVEEHKRELQQSLLSSFL